MNNILDNTNKTLETLKNELEIMVWTEELPHIIDKQKKKIEALKEELKGLEKNNNIIGSK